jgi:rfaE bifunctional protein nucleotidyltransferase chain/domain
VRCATVVTPNLPEALAFAGRSGTGLPVAAEAGQALRNAWECGAVVVTLGARGALVVAGASIGSVGPLAGRVVVPTERVGDADPCGAGDRLAATLTLELLAGASITTAVEAAVHRASVFLAEGGVSTLALIRPPVVMGGLAADALAVAERTRRAGGTVVATGGCFDLIHAGHARTLSAARSLGDCLIVCLNSDRSVRRLKGPDRPIIGEADRVALLLALECVDAVLVFDENTPEDALGRLRPDVWVKGGDYVVDDIPEARLVTSWGGCTVTVPYHPAHSTSLLASALARVG